MKNGIKGKLGAKLVAMFLFVISAVVLVASAIALIYLFEEDAFFDDGEQLVESVRESSLNNKMSDITFDIRHWMPFGEPAELPEDEGSTAMTEADDEDAKLKAETSWSITSRTEKIVKEQKNPLSSEDISSAVGFLNHAYSKDNTNISIEIYNSEGELIYNNFAIASPYMRRSDSFRIERYASAGVAVSKQFTSDNELADFVDNCQREGHLDYTEELILLEGVESDSYTDGYIHKLTGIYTEKYYEELTLWCSIPHALTVHDDIYTRVVKVETLVEMKYIIIMIAAVSALFLIASLIFVICSAGYSDRFDGLHLSLFDKAPLEIHLICAAIIVCAAIVLYYDYGFRLDIWLALALLLAMTAAAALVFIILIHTISARCKAGKLFHYTIIFGSIILLCRGIKYLFKNIRYSWKVALVFAAASAYDLFFVAMMMSSETELAVAMWLLGKLALAVALIIYAIGLGRIKDGCKKISEGKTDFVLNGTYLPPDLKSLAVDINSIGNGIQLAVDERTKSERLKTELITNVSHDLKTPLTSIVNYVDILSKQDIKPDTAKEYVGVLVRQSQRMKKLIDDLVEASKASSGAIAVNAQRVDMSLLITQAVTEFDERLEKSRLTPITSLPKEPVRVMVDGRLMWRVFDNLLGNICKYAQPETRVYISEDIVGDKVIVTFKNISRYALNISSEELMERFVRGDSSRHTEGSGLGLSIARSLCNLQKVGFGISIDGDLYKAQLTFDRLPNLPEDIQTEEAEPEEPKENEQTAPEVQPASEASAQNPVENKENLQAPAQIQPEIQHEESPQAENR